MSQASLRRLPHLLGLIVAVLLLGLAAACGDDDDGASPTAAPATTPAGTGPTESPSGVPQPGAAGIASDERSLPGLDAVVVDDGWAMFSERPAGEDRTGVTDDTIKVCRPVALTGPAAVWGSTETIYKAEIELLNSIGGIHGRTIEYVSRDDAYSPSQATQVVREFVEQDKCFMIFAAPGTGIHNAFLPFLAENGVPDFNAFVGGAYIGEPGESVATSGSASGLLAGFVLGNYIYDSNPDAQVAIIYQDDDTGRGQLESLRAAARNHGATIVAEQSFQAGEADLSSQVQSALNANPTDLYVYAVGADWPKIATAVRDTAGSNVQMYDPGGQSASSADALGDRINGIISAVNESYPYTDARPEVQAVNSLLQSEGVQPDGFAVLYGQTGIEALFRALECAGPDLTREGFIQAVNGGCFDGSWECSICLGPTVVTPEDRWMAETYMFQKWNSANKAWEQIKEPQSFETSFGNAVRGNLSGYECTADLPCPWEDGCKPDSADRCAWASVFE